MSPPPLRTIPFYFDFISPYAYLAWTQLPKLAEELHVRFEPVPILFAALLNHHGQKGPAEIPPKKLYVFKDTLRRAARLGIPLTAPPSHPFNPLPALRLASVPMDEAARHRLIDGLFQRTWAEGSGVDDPEKLIPFANAHGISDPVAAVTSPEVKLALRTQTDRALKDGVFGVPTMVVDGELFWGADSLPHLADFLRGIDPVDPDQMHRWAQITSSAER